MERRRENKLCPAKNIAGKNLPLSVEEFFKMKKAGRELAKEALVSVGITDDKFLKKMIGTISSTSFSESLSLGDWSATPMFCFLTSRQPELISVAKKRFSTF